jgi:hypothetical protein
MKKISILKITLMFVLAVLLMPGCSPKAVVQKQQWTEETIRKYLDENKDKLEPIEGIYSLSSDKEYKIFGLTAPSKKNNDFGRVAILKNTEGLTPEFFEYWLEGLDVRKYHKTGEFTRIQKSSSYLCKKMMPGADPVTYTFAYDNAAGQMEGVVDKSTVHAKLLYLKLYPEK